jgi:BlaI family transcriptional regulator, penicillinase repressor
MDVIYELGRAAVADVQERLPDKVSYSGVRALMRILEQKGHLKHIVEGQRYVYLPTEPVTRAAANALGQVMQVFFGGSVEKMMAVLLSKQLRDLSDEEYVRLERMIRQARVATGKA